jgi:branched-chain amino acid transport system permease protein
MQIGYGWIRQEIFAQPARIIALIFFVLLLTAPLLTQDKQYLTILTMTTIFAIFAMSWDLISGVTGQLSLGHGLFFGVAAYVAALLNLNLGWQPWLTIPLGAIVSSMFGLVFAIPALRLRGIYLALVTLTFPLIMSGIILVFPDFTGGELGLYGIQQLSQSQNISYYIVVLVFCVSAFIMYKLSDTESKFIRTGIILNAIREDEIAARTSGINTIRYKIMAFVISGFFAGVAGGLYCHYIRLAGPSNLEMFFSFQVVLWTIFGSIATIYGAVVGVFILYPLTELLSLFEFGDKIRFLAFGVVLIITLLFMPEGIGIWIRDKIELECPRCKLTNGFYRKKCRACRAVLSPERN